jgi:hypothetical protein
MNKTLTVLTFLFLAFCKIKAQVPYGLNSFPEASSTIYLDFDGETVTSSLWIAYTGNKPFICLPTTMTNAQMVKVFNHVAEDFSPFNINVTTDSAVFLSTSPGSRMRVIFTPTSSWYGSSGGTAFIDSWRSIFWAAEEFPCFVFTSILGNNDKRVAEAASHEVGHTLGLYHQSQYDDACVFQTEYFAGRGSGDIGWSPIMGNSYNRNLTTWHNGRSSLACSFLQDNLATITNPLNKVTFRKDDYTNLRDSAKYVKFTSGNYKIDGVISDSVDADFFKFGFTSPGRFTANINPYNTGAEIVAAFPLIGVTNYNGNIDLEATLYKDNTVIGVYNPATRLNASIDTLLNSGTYHLRISSAENVNIYKYGMLGSYTLSGSFGGEIALPIRQVNLFCNNIQGGTHGLSWNIISDEPLESIEIQVSRDGTVWNKLTDVSVTSTSYLYKPSGNRTLYYRLLVKSIVGELKFSNQCIINKSGGQASFTIANGAIINEGVEGNWRLFDVYGNIVLSGRLINGINYINSNKIIPGFYILQVIDSVGNVTSKKVIR